MTDKDFIKENIVGRRDSGRKRLQHYARLIFSALVFGVVSAVVFALAEPAVQRRLEPETEPPESVTLGQAEPPESTLAPVQPEPESSTEAIEDVVQNEIENYQFSMDAYDTMIANLAEVAANADYSVVEVRSIASGTDFLGGPLETADSYAGMVIATTADEVLILTSEQAVSNADSIQITLRSGSVVQGSLKGRDMTDGFAVVALPVSNLLENELDQLSAIALGNSSQVRKGDSLIAVGAPAGMLHSSSYGFVSFVATNYAGVDGSFRVIVSDLAGDAEMGSFLLNTRGELIGWLSTRFGEGGQEGYVRAAGLSDFRDRIERLSNGMQLAYFGINTQEVNRSMESGGVPPGIYVRGCVQNSPAYQAGIQSGDVVTQINGKKIVSMKDYTSALDALAPGEQAAVQVLRQSGDEYKAIDFTVAAGAR